MLGKSIIKLLKQQIGLMFIDLNSDKSDSDEYLLIYDHNHKYCLGFIEDKEDGYYESAAWSCGADCYLLVSEDCVTLHSAILSKPENIQINLVIDNLDKFFVYLKRISYKQGQAVMPYLFGQMARLYELLPSLEANLYYNCYSRFWKNKDINDLPKVLNDEIDNILEGISINNHTIVPNCELIQRHLLQDISCALSMIFAKGFDSLNLLQSSSISGPVFIDSFCLPLYVVHNLLSGNIHIDKNKPCITIFDPSIWSTTFIIECIRELRRNKYTGKIIVKGHFTLQQNELYIKQPLELLFDDNIEIDVSFDFQILNKWPDNCDIIIASPSYHFLDRLVTDRGNISINEYKSEMGYETVEEVPFEILDNACKHLSETGQLFLIAPTYILKEENYKEARSAMYECFSIEKIEHLGSFLMRGSGSLSFLSLCKRHSTNMSRTKIKWCKDSPLGYDESMRAEIIYTSGGANDNYDLREYYINEEVLRLNNCAPRPYSENIVIEGMIQHKDDGLLLAAQNLFTISVGIRTGNTKMFVLDKEQLKQIPETERSFFKPVVNLKSIQNGKLQDISYVFFPYDKDGCTIITSSELLKKLPYFGRQLSSNRKELGKRIVGDRTVQYWELAYWRKILVPGKKKIVSRSYGNRGSFGIDSDGSFVTMSGYQWMPKKQIADDKLLYSYLAILSTDFFWRVVRVYAERLYSPSNSVCYKLSVKSIGSVPLPDLSKSKFHKYIDNLFDYGLKISYNGLSVCDNKLEEIVMSLYNG